MLVVIAVCYAYTHTYTHLLRLEVSEFALMLPTLCTTSSMMYRVVSDWFLTVPETASEVVPLSNSKRPLVTLSERKIGQRGCGGSNRIEVREEGHECVCGGEGGRGGSKERRAHTSLDLEMCWQ